MMMMVEVVVMMKGELWFVCVEVMGVKNYMIEHFMEQQPLSESRSCSN